MLFELATGGDRDGSLSVDEFTEMLRMRLGHRPKEDNAQKWFKAMDTDGEGGREAVQSSNPSASAASSSSASTSALASTVTAAAARICAEEHTRSPTHQLLTCVL